MVIATGSPEPEQGLVDALLRPGDVFIDVGANLGMYTVPAALAGAVVIAFEPDRQAADQLASNVALNGLSVDARRIAVGRKSCVQLFSVGQDIANHLLPSDSVGQAIEVEVIALDDLDIPTGDGWLVLKSDAEGYDPDVVAGAKETLRRHKPRVAVIVEVWDGGVDVRAELEPIGFRPFRYSRLHRRLQQIGIDDVQEGNLVMVLPEALPMLEQRLSGGRPPKKHRVQW